MKQIDLHVHSNRSDGTLPPAKLVRLAAACGLSAFALTDHDNTDGLPEALREASSCGVEVIPGIEFSTEYHGTDIHILGLEFTWEVPAFQEEIQSYRDERLMRNRRMIQKMADDGIDISFSQMVQCFGDTVWTRAHFARYLTDHGYVSEMSEAFRTMIGEGCRYFVPRQKISPSDAVRLIRRYRGIPILAHPFQYHLDRAQLAKLIGELCDAGLIGIEAYYSKYDDRQTSELLALTAEYCLAPSGGSDFHGSNKPDISLGTGRGSLQIPYSILEELRRKLQEETDYADR